jgi:hypothetical protein
LQIHYNNISNLFTNVAYINNLLTESSCDARNQNVDHLHQTAEGEEKLISNISKQDKWTVNKSDLLNKHIQRFIHLVKSIDFGKI